MNEREEYLWVEKYRPRTIDDTILPESMKGIFNAFVEQGEVPNMILAGTAGVGKTTVARALCEQLGCDYIIINGSEDGNIGTLRNKIRDFASSMSFEDKSKVVILDEADYLNPNSTQPALRGFIEEFSANCRFILTCNFKNRILEPLHSRCSLVEFRLSNDDKPKMLARFMKRLEEILKLENVEYNKDVVAKLLVKHFPDYRRVINELQRYSVSGSIDEGILVDLTEDKMKALVKTLREQDWTEMRKWVAHNADNDPNRLIRLIFDNAVKYVEASSIPQLVLILGEYQYKVAFVADQEINMVAMLTEVMAEIKFKG